MKSVVVILIGIFYFFSVALFAQVDVQVKPIKPYQLSICYNKTTNLIFPYAIKSVDRGSSSVIAQKAKAVENILQVKAAKKEFEETNLSVVTGDGKFYSIVLTYADTPAVLNVVFGNKNPTHIKSIITGQVIDEDKYRWVADSIRHIKGFLRRHVTNQGMRLGLNGIYLKDDAIWFKLQLQNTSMIDYVPSSVQLFIRDKKKTRRTAAQEMELVPLYDVKTSVVKGSTRLSFALAIKPLTIPSSKELIIQVREGNGGRMLQLHVSHRRLLKARLFGGNCCSGETL